MMRTASLEALHRYLRLQALPEKHREPPPLITDDAGFPVEGIVEEGRGLHPSGWTLVQHTTKTLLRLAGLGRVVLVGRGDPTLYDVTLNTGRL